LTGRRTCKLVSMTGDKVRGDGRAVSEESGSQSQRIYGVLREMVLRGDFRPGERLSELPLAARLGASRTPIRLALERLAQEGLIENLRGAGFTVKTYSITEIYDAIELRGVIEGIAARLACDRLRNPAELEALAECAREIENLAATRSHDSPDFVVAYSDLNNRFHALLMDLASSSVLHRAWLQLHAIPYAAPSAAIISEAMQEALKSALEHHRAIVDAIGNGDGTLAERLAREHARIALKNVDLVLRDPRQNASLITFRPPFDRTKAS
jgi:GntR family transcriptional regulator, vanillate catabolism transcriptional regulator